MKHFVFCLPAFLFLLSFSVHAQELYKNGVEASYYADKFHGRPTSNGEKFNMYGYTCAHKSLPFNTELKVTNLANGKSVVVRVNDRGPFVAGREIDLSKAAAVDLDMIKTGTARVKIEILKRGPETKVSSLTAAKASGAAQTPSAGSASRVVEVKAGSLYDIQVGSFSSRDNAEKFARKLMDAGFKDVAFQKAANVTRVVVRKVPSEKVGVTLEKLSQKGYANPVVRERR